MTKQTVLITGANKSIGLETARQLAQAGYHILLGSRDADRGQRAVGQLKAEGLSSVELVIIDVASEASVIQAREQVGRLTDRLDVLINNAAIIGPMPQLPSTVSDEGIKAAFETNFFGPVRVIRHFIDLLRTAEVPRIVNVTSDLASLTLHNDPSWVYYAIKGAAYGPSKTALNAYTVALAYELRDTPFKVNMVNPGHTATDLNNHRGTKKVEDGARVIVQYAMLDASGPTGGFFSDYGKSPW
jgi:NAD(P)-dependent dehydrogenase (short-subunit alcohol dehydrogenase family)